MTLIVLTFAAVFVLIASAGLLLFHREEMLERIGSVINPGAGERSTMLGNLQQTGVSLGGMVERLERMLPKSRAEVSVVKTRLMRAGYRDEAAINTFYGAKILVPMVLCLLAVVIVHSDAFVFYIAALGVGFLAPDFWLGNRIKARQKQIG